MNMIAEVLAPQTQAAEATQPLQWLSRHVMRGRNVHHASTVLCVRVRLGDLVGRRTSSLPAPFTAGCIARFLDGAKVPPTAPDPQALAGLLRAPEGMALERLLLECLLVLERRLAFERHDFLPIASAEVRQGSGEGEVELVWASHETAISIGASRLVVAEFNRLLAGDESDAAESAASLDAEYARLVQRSVRRDVSKTTAVLLLAAQTRGLHAEWHGGPTVQFGQGASQRLAHSSVLEGDSMAAARLSRHKARTSRRLSQLGLPVPRNTIVRSTEAAIAAAQRFGFPVVLKPLRGRQGGGVTVGVRDAGETAAAFERARRGDDAVLVEEMVRGTTYRLLVIGGRFASALRIDPPSVRGDGRRTIRELVNELNADPVRDGIRLIPVEIDAELLQCIAAGGRTLESIPAAGEEVALRATANFSIGATHTDVTDLVHPAQAELAERACAAVGLGNGGVDLVCGDIALAPDAAHSSIVEVNARPGLCTHTFPWRGAPRHVASRVLDTIFPPPATGRVPTVLVLGRRGTLAMADAIAAELHIRKMAVGVAARQRCSIAGAPLDGEDLTLHEGVARMWRDPRVEALIAAVDPRRAVETGVALETADVACLLARDASDDPSHYDQAVMLAVSACRIAVARLGDDGVAPALESAVRKGILQTDSIHWLPHGTSRTEMALAVTKLLMGSAILH